ncbi:MAG TPA: hypothetical protein DCG75_01750 [Bacteroidales bacterium]|nr:hypothetical protein [Bacteroidales bacterium]
MVDNDVIFELKQPFYTKYLILFVFMVVTISIDYYSDKILFNDWIIYAVLGFVCFIFFIVNLFFVSKVIITKQHLLIKYPLRLKQKKILVKDIKSINIKIVNRFLRMYVFYNRDNVELGEFFTVANIPTKKMKMVESYFENLRNDS